MTRQNKRKLNLLYTEVPSDVLLPASWLRRQGISNKLAWWYVQSNWLERVAPGVYIKPSEPVTWAGVVYTLQHLLQLPIHIGAKSSLELLGRAHYIPMSKARRIILFTNQNVSVPAWLKSLKKLNLDFEVKKTNFLGTKHGIVAKKFEGYDVKLASPERAILEVMYLVPQAQSYEEAMLLIENLYNLRAPLIQQCLENCHSIKAKRLLLHFADYLNHPWVNELDESKINLGTGKRVIAGGGVYDKKYMISVPRRKGE